MNPTEAIDAILAEFSKASAEYPKFNSYHEGYAILKEEVDELWDEIKKKQTARSYDKIEKETVQVAAMAVRFLVDLM